MKFIIFAFILFFSCFNISYSQVNNDSLGFTDGVFHTYCLNGKKISSEQAHNLLRKNPNSLKYLSAANTNKSFGIIFLLGGSYLFVKAADIILNKDIVESEFMDNTVIKNNKKLFYIYGGCGVVITVGAIHLLVSHNKNLKKSIEIYNKTIRELGNKQPVTLNYGLVGNGIGVQLNF